MRTITVGLREITTQLLLIGLEGEQNSSQIIFDCSELLGDYPDATVSMAIKPPQGNIYPKAVEKVGNTVVWTISSSDCAIPGNGEYQLSFTDGTAIVKTFRGLFTVYDSLIGNGTAPDPVQDWIEDANAVLESLNEISASSEGLPSGSAPTAEITTVGGHKNIALGIPKGDKGDTGSTGATPDFSIGTVTTGQPGTDADASITGTPENPVLNLTIPRGSQGEQGEQGEQGNPGRDGVDGQPGFSPIATVTKSGNTATISITDKNGTTTAEVSDGTNGTDGFSPVATVTKSGDTATISITDKNGTTTATVSDGADGQPGATPDFSIGTVTTGDPGTDASASITGTAENPVLNLTIPRGATGEVTEAQLSALADRKADVITDSLENQDIATFSDGADNLPVSALSVAIEPVQDLHGYDAPWPGGGGKNKWNGTLSPNPTTTNGVTFTQTADGKITASNTATALAYTNLMTVTITEAGDYIASSGLTGGSGSTYYLRVYKNGDAVGNVSGSDDAITLTSLAVGDVIGFRCYVTNGTSANGVIYKPMLRKASVSDATWQPYSNISPISGWDAVNVWRTGKNIFPAIDGTYVNSSLTNLVCANGNYTLKNTSQYPLGVTSLMTDDGIQNAIGNARFLKPGTYTFSANIVSLVGTTSVTGIRIRMKDTSSGTPIEKVSGSSFTITTEHEIISFPSAVSGFPVDAEITFNIQLETGSSATTFEKYVGTSLPISLTSAGTVYGGSLDVVEGKVRVTKAEVDLGDLSWILTSGGTRPNFFSAVLPDMVAGSDYMSSMYSKTGNPYGSDENLIVLVYNYNNSGNILIRNMAYETAQAFTTAMDGVQLVYELATPVEYTLSPTEIRTLLGQNNLWADCGEVEEITYPADTKLYISKMIASAIASL